MSLNEELYVVCWGDRKDEHLGCDVTDDDIVNKPYIIAQFMEMKSVNVKQVSCGSSHTMFLMDTGLVYSLGSNMYGQLGRSGDPLRPERIDALEAMVINQVSCGGKHTLVLNDKGQVYSFGDNTMGQLGQGNLTDKFKKIPKNVKGFPQGTVISIISSGGNHCLALSIGGHVFAWGCNSNGQLGQGPSKDDISTMPQAVLLLAGLPIITLCAGENHSLALTSSGSLFSWGKNKCGQLGLTDEIDRVCPVPVRSIETQHVCHVTAGDNHTVVLTKEGRVFTFGDGSSGQLGHNSLTNESIPRQVLELMGSIVVQVSCGSKHTQALVSTGKLYVFGSGEKGQLGCLSKSLVKIPMTFNEQLSSAVSASGKNSLTLKPLIKLIASGGNQSFVVLRRVSEEPFDMRRNNAIRAQLFIDAEKVQEIVQRFKEGCSSQMLRKDVDFVGRVFASQANLNGSFLKSNTEEITIPRGHGIDMYSLRRSMVMLDSVTSFKKVIQLAVERRLIPSLSRTPLGFEAIRVYLILPELPALLDPVSATGLTVPLGNCILSLVPDKQKLLEEWWKTLPGSFFAKVVQIFQTYVKETLITPFHSQHPNEEWFSRQAALSTCMLILKKLDQVNEEAGSIVPFNMFYIPEIQERIDIRADYVNYVQQPNAFSFCQFPFVFDSKAKSILLQTDVLLQMKSAVDEVQRLNLQNMFSGLLMDPMSPMLILRIRRNNLIEDTLREIVHLSPFEFKKPLKVVFDGEEGVDAGGVKKEFFLLLLREIVHPKYGMFVEMEESNTLWFSHKTFDEPGLYLLIGIVCGLAIYNSIIIDVNFPLVLYKKLLGREPNLDDFRDVQPNVARNLQYLLDYTESDVEEVFGLTFQVSVPFFDSVQTHDLIPGGGNVPVTLESKEKYVKAYMDFFLTNSIEKQFAAFSEGFHRVCSGRLLYFFRPQELMEMVVGCQDYDFKQLEEGTVYKGEYYRQHAVIDKFWDVFYEFTFDMKKKFLAFLTGTDKVPIHGLKSLQFTIQPVSGGEGGDHLPVAHTCFNLLDLPRYPTKDIMRIKLQQAIEYYEGFGLA